jgi:2-polyprenyl-3-methyl-5-hydroxy-6-metoxy-1,4-benzoquinol methylase
VQPSARLLDVGTGDGRFLQACREAGYDVTGTEVSATGAAYAQRQGFDVRMGQVTELDLPAESFNVVTLWHVLEHVPEPGVVLRKVHSLLRPGGVLAVAVPNEENFFVRRRLGLPTPTSPFDPLQFGGEIHLTYFRPGTLRATLGAAGFEVLQFGVDDVYMNRNWKMKLKLRLQDFLARRFGWHFGVAMYAICRRSPSGEAKGA